MSSLVVFSGMPASGKTTLAARVARALQFEHIDKDSILEKLFEAEGCQSPEQRSILSRKSDDIFISLVNSRVDVVASSWWRHPFSNHQSGTPIEWLKKLDRKMVEVHCLCSSELALRRFFSRERHPGHFDHMKNANQLLLQLAEAKEHGPLFPSIALVCNTETELDDHAVFELVNAIKQAFADANTA